MTRTTLRRRLVHVLTSLALGASLSCVAAPLIAQPSGGARASHAMPVPHPDAPTVAVLLYDGMTALDAIGPLQMLGILRMQGWRIVTVAKTRGPVVSDAGYSVTAEASLAEVPRADVLIVPGGMHGTYAAARDTTITAWVQRIHAGTRVTASVCTGAWVLAGAGILTQGDTAATHWLGRDELERAGVVYSPERVHVAGRIWTSAGVSAGMDLGLALVEKLEGRRLAEWSQLVAQYDPMPPLDAGVPEKAPAAAAELRAMHERMMTALRAEHGAARTTHGAPR